MAKPYVPPCSTCRGRGIMNGKACPVCNLKGRAPAALQPVAEVKPAPAPPPPPPPAPLGPPAPDAPKRRPAFTKAKPAKRKK